MADVPPVIHQEFLTTRQELLASKEYQLQAKVYLQHALIAEKAYPLK